MVPGTESRSCHRRFELQSQLKILEFTGFYQKGIRFDGGIGGGGAGNHHLSRSELFIAFPTGEVLAIEDGRKAILLSNGLAGRKEQLHNVKRPTINKFRFMW